MPRPLRVVSEGVPHHVTQRGNRRGQIFFTNSDYLIYLQLLRDLGCKLGVNVIAYCLMGNHVHLVLVPATRDALPRLMQSLNSRYALRVNRENQWTGHLWEGRYFAAPLDEKHFWATVRYVECNPVRAGMVRRAEDYPWSSAAAHCRLRRDFTLAVEHPWIKQFQAIGDWSAWLAENDETVSDTSAESV